MRPPFPASCSSPSVFLAPTASFVIISVPPLLARPICPIESLILSLRAIATADFLGGRLASERNLLLFARFPALTPPGKPGIPATKPRLVALLEVSEQFYPPVL